jgi:PKD repeat protein
VIHGGQNVGVFPNVTQAQINSQITVLNADFAGTGFNVANLAATAFSAVGAVNSDISFCLAQVDPSGNPLTEPGIDRISYVAKGWTNPASVTTQNGFFTLINGTVKPGSIWNPTKYFNIWITDVNNAIGLLGYATFPSGTGLSGLTGSFGTSTTDGIWVWTRSFGNTGTLMAPYNKGRTATHETGHWLGLRHIGGDGNNNPAGDCNATDYCNDTPPQKGGFSGGSYGQNFGGPSYPLHVGVCPATANGDMFMNFMDYTDDAYNYMFTPDQNTRFQTALVNGPFRNQLNASSATLCNVPAVAPVADFTVEPTICRDSVLKPFNLSTGTPAPVYAWSANPSSGVSFSPNATSANPTLIFAFPGTYTLTLNATNSAGNNSNLAYIVVNDCGDGVGLNAYSVFAGQLGLTPNPSSGEIVIQTNFNEKQNLTVTIINSLGQSVSLQEFSEVSHSDLQMNLNELSNGVYTLSIDNGTERVMKRLILNK